MEQKEYNAKGYQELIEGIAREYVRNVDWRIYYKTSLSFEDDQLGCCSTDSVFLRFSRDDIEYIQCRTLELARESGHNPSTFNDAVDELGTLVELKGRDERLDYLLFGIRAFGFDKCDVDRVDLDNPTWFYDFAVQICDCEKNEMGNPLPFNIQLTEDEYVFMLKRAIITSRHWGEYTFNRLLNDDPGLACKINKRALSKIDGEHLSGTPYIVLLGDLNSEMKEIMAANAEVIDDYFNQMNSKFPNRARFRKR